MVPIGLRAFAGTAFLLSLPFLTTHPLGAAPPLSASTTGDAAAVWTVLEHGEDGSLRYAEGRDAAGRPLRIAWSVSATDAYGKNGSREVAAIFQRGGESLAIRSRLAGAADFIEYRRGGERLRLERTTLAGGADHGFEVVLMDEERARLASTNPHRFPREATRLAERLARSHPLTELVRDWLRAQDSLPFPLPPTADVLAAPLLLAADGQGEIQTVPFGANSCYQDCSNGCAQQCGWLCRNGSRNPLCLTCMGSCSLGCAIGCGCLTCNEPPLIRWQGPDDGRF